MTLANPRTILKREGNTIVLTLDGIRVEYPLDIAATLASELAAVTRDGRVLTFTLDQDGLA